MSASDPIPSIRSARMRRVALDKAWLKLDLGAVHLRGITVYRLPDLKTFKLLCPGSTERRDHHPYIVLSAEFEVIISCLLEVLWEKTEPKFGQTDLPISVDWYAKARK